MIHFHDIFFIFVQGERRIDLALAAAAQQMSQTRPNAAKIVILITTGLQAQVFGMTPLDEASRPLRDANANVVVIGIGKEPDSRELNLITGNPKAVEIISTPDEVIVNVHLLSKQLRQDALKGTDMIVFVYLFFSILGHKMSNKLGSPYFHEKEGRGAKVSNNKISQSGTEYFLKFANL